MAVGLIEVGDCYSSARNISELMLDSTSCACGLMKRLVFLDKFHDSGELEICVHGTAYISMV